MLGFIRGLDLWLVNKLPVYLAELLDLLQELNVLLLCQPLVIGCDRGLNEVCEFGATVDSRLALYLAL